MEMMDVIKDGVTIKRRISYYEQIGGFKRPVPELLAGESYRRLANHQVILMSDTYRGVQG